MPALLPAITVFLLIISTIESATVKRCNLQFKCSLEENSVSATDGEKCYVFRNGCFFARENCNRINECLSELKVITREKCKSLCSKICPLNYKPVCCFYNKTKKTFSNGCELNRFICESGKTCVSTKSGQCSPDL